MMAYHTIGNMKLWISGKIKDILPWRGGMARVSGGFIIVAVINCRWAGKYRLAWWQGRHEWARDGTHTFCITTDRLSHLSPGFYILTTNPSPLHEFGWRYDGLRAGLVVCTRLRCLRPERPEKGGEITWGPVIRLGTQRKNISVRY